MTVHVNIGKAKSQLSRLVAAAVRGEDVVLDKDGKPQVRLVPVAEDSEQAKAERQAKRESVFDMYAVPPGYEPPLISSFKMSEAAEEERFRRKFGPPD